jgi:GNAT superfamily N-acetyltransferase
MLTSLRKLKTWIKSEPTILLKKPWLVFLLPIILIIALTSRLKSTKTVLYLTETDLDGLLKIPQKQILPNLLFHRVTDFNEFMNCAMKRRNEDPELRDILLEIVKQRFNKGDFALICSDYKKDPLSYLFICTDSAEFTPVGINLRLPDFTFGMYDVYTFKDSRGKGYYSFLFYHAVDYMMKQGYNSMWLWLMAHNSVSVKVHNKLGIDNISKILTEKMNYGFIRRNVQDVKMLLADLVIHD